MRETMNDADISIKRVKVKDSTEFCVEWPEIREDQLAQHEHDQSGAEEEKLEPEGEVW